jgi:asparagine synthase (glutamine-hydrolysing)
VHPEIDLTAMREFLALLYVPNPGTIFRGIKKLQPGHTLTWKNGEIRIIQFWDGSRPAPRVSGSHQDLIHQCREILRDSVRRQMVSDVPVGFFLSGGLDSSALLACASEVHNGPLRCYTISYRKDHSQLEQSAEDSYYAKIVAQRYGAECHEIEVDPDVTTLLPKVIWHLDDAIADPAAISTWLISHQAKSESTVLLSGQGGDELFAGYRVHLVERFPRWMRLVPAGLRQKCLLPAIASIARNAGRVPGISPGLVLAYCRYIERVVRLTELTPPQQFAGMRSYHTEAELENILTEEALRASRPHDEIILDHFRNASSLESLEQLLYADQHTFLPDLNLTYTDKVTMAASIEARVPFLDNEMIDFMRSIPPSLKLNGYNQKYILKEAMKDILPKGVITRRKAGFGLPVRSWLRNELKEMIGDLLSEKRVRERGLFHPNIIARMIEENRVGTRDYALQLWSLLTLEVWQQTFIDTPVANLAR